MRGREGFENRDYPQADMLKLVLKEAASVRPDTASATSGADIGRQLQADRLSSIEALLARHKADTGDQ